MRIEEKEYSGYRFIIVDNGILKVTFCDLGASLYSVVFDDHEMLLTPRALEDFIKNNYYGKIVGRIANRVEKGLVHIDDKDYQLPLNEKGNCLHGGCEGLNRVKFDCTVETNNVETKIKFNYLSREDKQSLPGDVYFSIVYTLKANDSKLYLSLNAESNKNTMIGLTNHTYFSVGENSARKTKLQIKASKFINARKSDLIPLYVVPVVSCLDYQNLKPTLFDIDNLFLQDHASYGVDHCFILDKPDIKEPNVIFQGEKYTLTIYTDFDSVQVYTCNYPDGLEKRTCLNDRYEGAAIEPQDSLLNRKIGQHFANQIIYSFSKN